VGKSNNARMPRPRWMRSDTAPPGAHKEHPEMAAIKKQLHKEFM
jgi:hypothetical protein